MFEFSRENRPRGNHRGAGPGGKDGGLAGFEPVYAATLGLLLRATVVGANPDKVSGVILFQFRCSSLGADFSCGADVNRQAMDMVTPLVLAAAGGHHEIVRLLIQRGAKVNHMDVVGNTALMYAAAGNHPHTCNELLNKGANFTDTNEDGETAYSLAVKQQANLSQAVLENYISALLMS